MRQALNVSFLFCSSHRVPPFRSFGSQECCDFAALSDIANLTRLGPRLFRSLLEMDGKGRQGEGSAGEVKLTRRHVPQVLAGTDTTSFDEDWKKVGRCLPVSKAAMCRSWSAAVAAASWTTSPGVQSSVSPP